MSLGDAWHNDGHNDIMMESPRLMTRWCHDSFEVYIHLYTHSLVYLSHLDSFEVYIHLCTWVTSTHDSFKLSIHLSRVYLSAQVGPSLMPHSSYFHGMTHSRYIDGMTHSRLTFTCSHSRHRLSCVPDGMAIYASNDYSCPPDGMAWLIGGIHSLVYLSHTDSWLIDCMTHSGYTFTRGIHSGVSLSDPDWRVIALSLSHPDSWLIPFTVYIHTTYIHRIYSANE